MGKLVVFRANQVLYLLIYRSGVRGAFSWENRLYFVGTKFFICLFVDLGCVFVGKSVIFRVKQPIHFLICTFGVCFSGKRRD